MTFDGVVQGWAKDNANPNAKVTVVFHINDTGVGMGTSIGTQTADQNGLVSTSSPAYQHSFAFTLPDVYRNGKPHTVNVYAYTATAANMLPTGSKAYTAYAQTVAGKNYFDTTVKPAAMTSCGNCHIIDYNAQYQALSYPAPFNGGTATNNSLIGHPAGLISHPGGNVCGGVNGNPCSLFQQWWKLEFEQP